MRYLGTVKSRKESSSCQWWTRFLLPIFIFSEFAILVQTPRTTNDSTITIILLSYPIYVYLLQDMKRQRTPCPSCWNSRHPFSSNQLLWRDYLGFLWPWGEGEWESITGLFQTINSSPEWTSLTCPLSKCPTWTVDFVTIAKVLILQSRLSL